MNFLAHCGLANDAAESWQCDTQARQGLLAGAFIGDFVKGAIPAHWPLELRAGTRLHRKVDALSNIHPGVRNNCERYPAHLRRFAPIFVDMLADHCLSHTWEAYYGEARDSFSKECYKAIQGYANYLPPDARRFFKYMQETDLLANYDQWLHVARGLQSILRRLRREHWFDEVEAASLAVLSGSRQDFNHYFPELRNAWKQWNAFQEVAGG